MTKASETENETVVAALNAAIGERLSRTETAAAASKWATARNINGMSIDGTAIIMAYAKLPLGQLQKQYLAQVPK